MVGAGVGPRQIGPARWRVSVKSLLRDAGSSYNSCGVNPAFVRSPPLLAPKTSVIVASESKSCLLPSAFFANAQAVLAISWGLKRAARFCFAISDAIASKSSEELNSAVEKALRGNEIALVVPNEGQTPRHAPS